MNRWRLTLLVMLGTSGNINAYEIGTHALITREAVTASVLSPNHPKSIVPALGFNRLDDLTPVAEILPVGTVVNAYFDNSPLPQINLSSNAASGVFERSTHNFEGWIFERLLARGYLGAGSRSTFENRVEAWVMRGAIREDDNDVGPYSIGERDDDPWNYVFRAARHFYDPVNNRALSDDASCAAFGCRRATEWMLGRTSVLTGSGALDTTRENHFSWQDARDNYWWALTYKRDSSPPGLSYGEAQQQFAGKRSLRFATTLKSIGQVVHLLQDMAQPQHTRNDAHGPPSVSLVNGDSPADGAYEAYTEARLFREIQDPGYSNPLTHFDGSPVNLDDLPPLRLRGNVAYPVPNFSTSVKFFTTAGTGEPVSLRRGMADLSNRGFFSASTLPVNVETGSPDPLATTFLQNPPMPDRVPGFYTEFPLETALFADGVVVRTLQLLGQVPDFVAPNWNAQSGLFSEYDVDGRMPLLAASQTKNGEGLIPSPTPVVESTQYTMSHEVFSVQADALLPRAVAYSAGMIDFFFRGRLEVSPIEQNVFAVLHHDVTHSVDAEGYPRKVGGTVFGFEMIRLRVRNVTDPIIESGAAPFPQVVGASVGTLVAVARYHRNACYKPDLTGERIQTYAPPPQLVITEPTCAPNEVKRTEHQEISVSAPLAVASEADLPGGRGPPLPAAVDKEFDFSGDPIPVNATDLFIQVIYRGPLGQEPDGIAVGTYDVREPTFVGIFNNSDYFFNGTSYLPQGGSFPRRAADNFRACAGVPSKFIFLATGSVGAPSLGLPNAGAESGVIRLALLFGVPVGAQRFAVRSVPMMIPPPSAPQRSGFTRGLQRQASKERYLPSGMGSLPAPTFCQLNQPDPGANVWCFDPIQKRRGLLVGDIAQPIYYDTAGNDGPDVDSVPLPQFATPRLARVGENRFNIPGPLVNCPAMPASADSHEKSNIEMLELEEEAWNLGIDPVSE